VMAQDINFPSSYQSKILFLLSEINLFHVFKLQ
jgi:hypothetical protein